MSLPDTPLVARLWCPSCEPGADPEAEILDVLWCNAHSPDRGGLDDALVTSHGYLAGGAESGGDDNRRWCQVVHGGRR